jgi:hypothetical protein
MQRDCPSKWTVIATADGGYVSASDIDDENIIAANISGFDDGAEEVLGISATNNYRTLIVHLALSATVGGRQTPTSQPFQHVSCCQGLPCAYNH